MRCDRSGQGTSNCHCSTATTASAVSCPSISPRPPGPWRADFSADRRTPATRQPRWTPTGPRGPKLRTPRPPGDVHPPHDGGASLAALELTADEAAGWLHRPRTGDTERAGAISLILNAGAPPPLAAPVAPERLMPTDPAGLVSQLEGARGTKLDPVILFRVRCSLGRGDRQSYQAHERGNDHAHFSPIQLDRANAEHW
jgi:hypothetical protein